MKEDAEGKDQEAVDPRMAKRARKVNGAKKKRRIRRRALLVLGLLAFVGLGLWVVYLSPFFDVDKIRFTGIANASLEEISSITDRFAGEPLAGIDIESASDKIRELPWVKEVKINRSWWGGDISVTVIERTPVAVQAIADGYALIGREGKIFENISEPGKFPVVEGVSTLNGWVKDAEPALETAEQLSAVQDIANKVRAVVVAESGELYLNLNEGGWIRLGDTRELPDKLRSARTFLQNVGVRCDQMLDVRSPLATAVTSGHNCKA